MEFEKTASTLVENWLNSQESTAMVSRDAEQVLCAAITAAIRADRAARDPCNMTGVKVNVTPEQIDGFLRVRNETGHDIKAGTLVYFSPDDAAFREKVRTMCRLAAKAQNYFVEKPGDLSTLAREVLAMLPPASAKT